METLSLNSQGVEELQQSSDNSFIGANTLVSSLNEIRNNHIIPVFSKDNEPVISQSDFIESTFEIASQLFPKEKILRPTVRLSHPIKGRIPEAKDKPAEKLLDHERTLYYERMAFVIEIPTIFETINGNNLVLTVGGVKSHNLDNLYGKNGSDQSFKIFIGFQNTVCLNLCVWTDGYKSDLRVQSIGQLKACIRTLFESYNAVYHLRALTELNLHTLTEKQFALMVGRCRLYQHLPQQTRSEIKPPPLSDTQFNTVVKEFYRDKNFCKDEDGDIDLWRLYNLITGANKSSYIDTFLDRDVNAYDFVEGLKFALKKETFSWFLH
jgi:hypothetical protein